MRAREESQSSDTYTKANEAIYVLTRIWGGLEVRPTKYLTAYIQFVDAHALGLPIYYAVSESTRRLRSSARRFWSTTAKNVKIFAGRQELRYGNERMVGISNWTNDQPHLGWICGAHRRQEPAGFVQHFARSRFLPRRWISTAPA